MVMIQSSLIVDQRRLLGLQLEFMTPLKHKLYFLHLFSIKNQSTWIYCLICYYDSKLINSSINLGTHIWMLKTHKTKEWI